jgi:hypothetical protein
MRNYIKMKLKTRKYKNIDEQYNKVIIYHIGIIYVIASDHVRENI